MRFLAAMGFALCVTGTPASAYLYCSEPSAPRCLAGYSSFDSQDDFDTCRRQMVRYKDEVETYVSCLVDAANSAKSEYGDAVKKFNRKAQG